MLHRERRCQQVSDPLQSRKREPTLDDSGEKGYIKRIQDSRLDVFGLDPGVPGYICQTEETPMPCIFVNSVEIPFPGFLK